MDSDLKGLRINRSSGDGIAEGPAPSRFSARWIVGGIVVLILVGAAAVIAKRMGAAAEGDTVVAAHKIEVAAKVVGKVAWIGVEKGDRVKEGQVLVRLEDDEYRAQLKQYQGQLVNLKARL